VAGRCYLAPVAVIKSPHLQERKQIAADHGDSFYICAYIGTATDIATDAKRIVNRTNHCLKSVRLVAGL